MHDNLRLQRLVQQLSIAVKEFMGGELTAPKSSADSDRHQEIMALAEATFKEMSLQVFIALLPVPWSSHRGVANACFTGGKTSS